MSGSDSFRRAIDVLRGVRDSDDSWRDFT
jgi:hypothetical protein